MEFAILFTSQPEIAAKPYPHRYVHARVTQQILRADEFGYDYAWVAEHHFSSCSVCRSVLMLGTLAAARTGRLRIGTAVSWAPFYHPLRLIEADGRVGWEGAGGCDGPTALSLRDALAMPPKGAS